MTLSTSRDERMSTRGEGRISMRRYAVATVACAAFSAVYEHFSHGVVSWWMVGLCGYPLVLGLLPALACVLAHREVTPLARQLWACGVMTLAVGSCLRGVVEIYGTTSGLIWPYLPVGLMLLVCGAAEA